MKSIRIGSTLLLAALLVSCASTSPVRHPASDDPTAGYGLGNHPWYGDNLSRLQKMIHTLGTDSTNYNPNSKPVATFDWDNTVMKNDAGDAMFFWLVANDKIKSPKDWDDSSAFLTNDAVSALNSRCRNSTPGTPLITSQNSACADLLLSVYDAGKLTDDLGGAAAWTTEANPDTIVPAYAWVSQVLAGYSPDEVRDFSRQAKSFNLNNPVDATQRLGTKSFTAWVRVYDQIKDLITSLKASGFDVWIVTASPQSVIEVYAEEVGITPDHVVGIRSTLTDDGKMTAKLEGCGTFADGNQEIITYRQGKRCFINKMIFGVKGANPQMSLRSPTAFAAGDSDTDVYFVKDALHHLAINRNKSELMCNAYANLDRFWIINPMFIEPLARKQPDATGTTYSCKQYGVPDLSTDAVAP